MANTFVMFDNRNGRIIGDKTDQCLSPARNDEDYYNFVDNIEPDEHPAWHCFGESIENNLMEAIYDAGFVRFGTYLDKFNEKIVETESAYAPNKDYVKALMTEVGAAKAICRKPYLHYSGSRTFFKL
jgi:hypothetical protein